MAKYATLKAAIEEIITTNGNYEISGEDMRNTLKAIVDSLGANYQLVGFALPATDPGTPDQNVAYLAGPGMYPNFGPTTVEKGQIGLFKYNGTWSYETIDCGVSIEYEEYPGGDAFEWTFYDSDNPDGLTIKIAKTVSGLGNDPNVAISQWWAAQTERKINVLGGYTISIDSLTTTPQSLGLFKAIQSGQIIDSITGANKLIFGTDGGGSVTVNASDLPYKATANLINVRTESGTANNVSIVVRGINDILPAYININEIANHPGAYASAAAALSDVPALYRRKGVKVVFYDDDSQLWIEMLCIDDAGANWWTDIENNWVIEGPISVLQNPTTGNKEINIGDIIYLVATPIKENITLNGVALHYVNYSIYKYLAKSGDVLTFVNNGVDINVLAKGVDDSDIIIGNVQPNQKKQFILSSNIKALGAYTLEDGNINYDVYRNNVSNDIQTVLGAIVSEKEFNHLLTNLNDAPINSILSFSDLTDIVNSPTNNSATLLTFNIEKSYLPKAGTVQILSETTGHNVYIRTASGNPTIWSSWQKFAFDSDIENLFNKKVFFNETLNKCYDASETTDYGEALYANGRSFSNPVWGTTPYLNIDGASKLYYTGIGLNSSQFPIICYYDEYKKFISAVFFSDALLHIDEEYTIPVGAKYVRCMCSQSIKNTAHYFSLITDLHRGDKITTWNWSYIADILRNFKLNKVDTFYNDKNNVFYDLNGDFTANGQALNADGTTFDNASNGCSPLLLCKGATKLFYTGKFGATATFPFVAFFKKDYSLDSVVYATSMAQQTELEITIPTTAYYVRVACQKTATAFNIYFDKNISIWDYMISMDEINKTNIQELQKDVADLDAIVGTLNIPMTTPAIFQRIGVIGDSYASGWLDVTGSAVDWYNISWPQVLARLNGVTGINFTQGGLTTRSWLTNVAHGLSKLNSEDVCDLYMLVLGINDAASLGASYLGTIADIHDNDPSLNADTFYGNYGRIVEAIKTKAPNAKICFVTMAHTGGNFDTFNTAIQAIAAHYSVPCLIERNDAFFTSTYFNTYKISNHPSVPLYGGMAKAIERLLVKNMVDNPSYWNVILPTN